MREELRLGNMDEDVKVIRRGLGVEHDHPQSAKARSQHDRLAVGRGVGDAVPFRNSGDYVYRPLGDFEAAPDWRGDRRLRFGCVPLRKISRSSLSC